MTNVDVTASFAATFVDELVRNGVKEAVIAPGSRSAPLALALARHPAVRVHVVLDERSAAFRALGIGLASGRPALVCCTSGTAAANFHPAVIEAHHARVPLIVCTADRPPELRDVGAPQTINQAHLYGAAVRWFHDPGPPEADGEAPTRWRTLACRAFAAAMGAPPGPVHLNLPFREPLVPAGGSLVDAPGRANGAPWVTTTRAPRGVDADAVRGFVDAVRAQPEGLIVAGWGTRVAEDTLERFAAATGWPVLADAISGLRSGPFAVSTYERIARTDAPRPSVVLRVGAPLTSKVANAWLEDVPTIALVPDDTWLDPNRTVSQRIVADEEMFMTAVADELGAPRSSVWLDGWLATEREHRGALDDSLDRLDEPVEGLIARDLAAALPVGANLVVASSLPVRALEWCMAPRSGIRVFANRGANGIDGFVSTARGIASGPGAPTVAFCGDLAFLHDTNGLLGATESAPVTFVVIDNDGGGIFGFLPPASLSEYETLFATPQNVDVVAVAQAQGVPAERVKSIEDVKLDAQETRVYVVPVDRARSVVLHADLLRS